MTAERSPAAVCMLTHSYYEEDARVRREAETLAARGHPVDVFALRRRGDPRTGQMAGVRVIRLDVRRHQGAGLGTYFAEYVAFVVRALVAVTRAHRRTPYALVQVHTLPDFLVAAALPLKLARVPVVLDLHEAMPEFFAMRFASRLPPFAATLARRLLLLQERLSVATADAVLTVNDALAERLVALGIPAAKVSVVVNAPDLSLFDAATVPRRDFAEDGVVRLVYAGALTPTYEVDVAIRALALLRDRRPELAVRLAIYGRGDAEAELCGLARSLRVDDVVTFGGRIPLEAVPAAIAAADIGIAPTRRDPFTEASLSTKILEYATLRRPVVASALATVRRYFPDDELELYEPGDPLSFMNAIVALVDAPAHRTKRVDAAARRVDELAWHRQASVYLAVVESIIGSARRGR